jgi:hypothetical protein
MGYEGGRFIAASVKAQGGGRIITLSCLERGEVDRTGTGSRALTVFGERDKGTLNVRMLLTRDCQSYGPCSVLLVNGEFYRPLLLRCGRETTGCLERRASAMALTLAAKLCASCLRHGAGDQIVRVVLA